MSIVARCGCSQVCEIVATVPQAQLPPWRVKRRRALARECTSDVRCELMANADANLEVSPEAAARKARSSLGGFARAASLTPSQRAKIAKRGGSAGALTRSECKHEGTVRH